MADSIIDVTTRLTYELQGKGLTEAANALGQQIKQLQTLQAEEKRLMSDRKSAGQQDVNTQQAISNALLKNQKAQKEITNQITQSVAGNKKLLATMNEEIRSIQRIESELKDVRALRDVSSKEEVVAINQRIRALERERQAILQSGTATGGLLEALLPEGRLSTQIGQGLLYGLGIGSGFGIITRAASALVEELQQVGSQIFNTIDYQKQLADSANSVSSALQKEADELGKIMQLFSTIDENNYTQALQRQLEIVKARGVVQGETFAQSKNVFDAQQQVRKGEIADIDRTAKAYQDLGQILKNVSSSVNTGSFQKFFPFTSSLVQGGKSNREIIDAIFKREGAARDIPASILNAARLNLEGTETGDEIVRGINKTLDDFSLKGIELAQNRLNKENEITSADLEFKAEIAEKQYQLNRELSIRLRGLNADLSEQRIQDEIQVDRQTVQRIRQTNSIRRNEELARVNDEIELSRKAGTLTAETADKYGRIKADINAKYNEQIRQETLQYNIAQNKAAVEQSANEVKLQLESSQKELQVAVQTNQDTLGIRQRIAQQQTQAELNEVYKKYDELFAAAYKSGIDTTQLAEEFNQAIELVQVNGQRRSLSLLDDYYNDRSRIINERLNSEHQDIQADANAKIDAEREAYEDGEQSLRGYHRERRRIDYQAYLDEQQLQKKRLELLLQQAKAERDTVRANPNAQPIDIQRAETNVKTLENSLSKINQQITDTGNNPSGVSAFIFGNDAFIKDKGDRQRAEIKKTIDAYQTLTHAAVQGFNTIYEAQQALLDREIAIREKRVDIALKLAERGNTEALRIEQERLEAAQRQRELYARRQQQINAALAVSEAIVAVATAAGETGAGAIAVVPAVIAAIVAGYAAISSATRESSDLAAFADGVENFKGKGTGTSDSNVVRISKGESVLTAKATQQYAGIPTMMNNGTFPRFADVVMNNRSMRHELDDTNKRLDKLIDAMGNLEFRAQNKIDGYGVSQLVETNMKMDRRRFAG